jgi:hypothetical protein
MRAKMRAWPAWIWFGVIVALTVWDVAKIISDHSAYSNVFALLESLIASIAVVAFAFVGALIISRQSRNTIGWLLLIATLIAAVDVPRASYLNGLESIPAEPPVSLLVAAWLGQILWLPFLFSVMLILQLFPTGRPLSPRWRWLVAAGLGLVASFVLLASFGSEFHVEENITFTIPNPVGFLPATTVESVLGIWIICLVLFFLASGASLFLRYRRAGQVERKQIKWLLSACGLFVAVYIPGLWLSDAAPPFHDIWGIVFDLSMMAVPVAIAIAILRYNLWDIDLIIRRTLVYAVLTGLLALTYLGSVIVLQTTLGALAGEQSPVIIVLSTLTIAALFSPLRRRVQRVIDRRFFRQKYDAARVTAQFAAAARDEVDLDRLTAELIRVIDETMQPASLSIRIKKL